MTDRFDTAAWKNWLRPAATTEVERARRSEQHFWLKASALLAVCGCLVVLGVLRVKHTAQGVRTAYELVKTTDELRVQLEENRRLEAKLTGLKNPNDLRKEAGEDFDMRSPSADDQQEVD